MYRYATCVKRRHGPAPEEEVVDKMSDDNPVRELRVVLAVDDEGAALRLYRDVLGLPIECLDAPVSR